VLCFLQHVEDLRLGSALKLVYRKEKIEFTVPADNFQGFMEYLRMQSYPQRAQDVLKRDSLKVRQKYSRLSDAEMRSKLTMYFPDAAAMEKYEIDVHIVHAGEFIILPPGCWHWGINKGPNAAVSVNYLSPDLTSFRAEYNLMLVCNGHTRGELNRTIPEEIHEYLLISLLANFAERLRGCILSSARTPRRCLLQPFQSSLG
jgi:hypothetical protein